MKVLLSLPPNLVTSFHEITGFSREKFFCTSDPIGHRVGSGGGSVWLLRCYGKDTDKKIIIHAGGESRRLPSYSTSGKILTPVPGHNACLLEIQLPLYEAIMEKAPKGVNTLIASGDVLIRSNNSLQDIPNADVICYGLKVGRELGKNHGMFAVSRDAGKELDFMMQKPSVERLVEVEKTHDCLMDVGIWLLSDKAVEMLEKRSQDDKGNIKYYDLYSDFGRCLGQHPEIDDMELNKLIVKILPLKGGEFYHFGTSRELISSTRKVLGEDMAVKNAVFIQNSVVKAKISEENRDIWIENSFVGKDWELSEQNIITGVPENDWEISLKYGDCLDIVPIYEKAWAVRPYSIDDPFKYKAFPVVDDVKKLGDIVNYIVVGKSVNNLYSMISAEEILNKANLKRLFSQRTSWNLQN